MQCKLCLFFVLQQHFVVFPFSAHRGLKLEVLFFQKLRLRLEVDYELLQLQYPVVMVQSLGAIVFADHDVSIYCFVLPLLVRGQLLFDELLTFAVLSIVSLLLRFLPRKYILVHCSEGLVLTYLLKQAYDSFLETLDLSLRLEILQLNLFALCLKFVLPV